MIRSGMTVERLKMRCLGNQVRSVGLKFQETEILIIQVMSNKKKSIVLIDPDVLQRIQQDIDQDLYFKKASFLCYIW